jgi:hypothetical protein
MKISRRALTRIIAPNSAKEETSMTDQFDFGGVIVWRPTQAHIERSPSDRVHAPAREKILKR